MEWIDNKSLACYYSSEASAKKTLLFEMDARLRSHSDILTGLSTLTAANKIVQRGRFIMVAEYSAVPFSQ